MRSYTRNGKVHEKPLNKWEPNGEALLFGVDVGTQGARIVLVDQLGELVASEAQKFELSDTFRQEQSPLIWWTKTMEMLSSLTAELPTWVDKSDICAISVTSTSGTVIPLDKQNRPIHDALMYSDPRSAAQGERCQEIAKRYVKHGYTGFNASSGISKMCWFVDTFPERVDDIALWIHASDYIVGQLSGNYHMTDYTNVLKSGYDLETLEWPSFVCEELGLKRSWLQDIMPSGTVVGTLLPHLATALGLGEIAVVVGMTDGCATQMASGAVKPGDWNTTIGTTLVIKGVTQKKCD